MKLNFEIQKNNWIKHFKKFTFISYPSEGVIRIFLGKFPKLKKKFYKRKQKILDLGHGDGRHFGLFKSVGLKSYGLEISDQINKKAKELLNTKTNPTNITLKVGCSEKIPYKDSFFHHVLLWNSCYYMSNDQKPDFSKHVDEYARILKKNGYIIVSIPKKDCFNFVNAKKYKNKYKIISQDYNTVTNGQVMRYFKNEREIRKEFSRKFKNFIFSDIDQNWFGLRYKWHIFIAKKK